MKTDSDLKQELAKLVKGFILKKKTRENRNSDVFARVAFF